MLKRLLSAVLVAATMMTMGISVFAEGFTPDVSIEMIDDMLRDAKTPENIIQSMDDELKRFIYEKSLSKSDVEYINVVPEEDAPAFFSSAYEIPDTDLKLSVTAFKVSGKQQVDIYPSYEWLVPVRPRGKDYFGYSTHQDFSVVPNDRSNLIWYKMEAKDSWSRSGPATYTNTALTGYQHQGDSLGTPDFPIYIKGDFHYKVDIDTASPVKKIVLEYVHDTSSGGNISYGIGYGPASINLTRSTSDVGHKNNAFNLVY